MNPNKQNQSREIDPRYQHLEGFRHTFGDIRRRQFLAAQATGNTIEGQEPTTGKTRHAFARVAGEYSAKLSDSDPRKMYSQLLATMPGYFDGLQTLDSQDDWRSGHRVTREQHIDAVDHIIKYNDVIRDIINHNPRIQPDVLMSVVTAAAVRYKYSDKERTTMLHDTKGLLKGMQHELAFESALYYLPDDFEIVDTVDGDDAKGADFKVRCPNGVVVSIDVKATQRLEDEERAKKAQKLARYGKKPPQNEIVLYSGFDREDFDADNPWRPRHEAVERTLPRITAELLHASGSQTHSVSPELVK